MFSFGFNGGGGFKNNLGYSPPIGTTKYSPGLPGFPVYNNDGDINIDVTDGKVSGSGKANVGGVDVNFSWGNNPGPTTNPNGNTNNVNTAGANNPPPQQDDKTLLYVGLGLLGVLALGRGIM